MSGVKWVGNNTREVKTFLSDSRSMCPRDPVFFSRRGAGMTQSPWKNVASDDWGPEVSAAIYDPWSESYLPVRTDQWIHSTTEGFMVSNSPTNGLTVVVSCSACRWTSMGNSGDLTLSTVYGDDGGCVSHEIRHT